MNSLQSRPVWAEINLDNIKHNFLEVRRLIGDLPKILAIVKANAYGHGAVKVAHTLEALGADYFGVAILAEAIQLRTAGIQKPILILGWTPTTSYREAIANDITLTIFSLEEAEELSRISKDMRKRACVHLKIDTGMGRIGFRPGDDSLKEIGRIMDLYLDVEGIFTHLAKADERDKSYTSMQVQRFADFAYQIENMKGKKIVLKHAANSAAVIDHPEAYFDMVRPGVILYGMSPSDEVQLERIDLRQAFTLRAQVSMIKKVPQGNAISYGGRFITSQEGVIATLPLGYADGYARLLSGRSQIICHGQRFPVIGRICMDQLMFDATSSYKEIKQGDVVTLIGADKEEFISVNELADIIGTINYEITCMISGRVPRIYK